MKAADIFVIVSVMYTIVLYVCIYIYIDTLCCYIYICTCVCIILYIHPIEELIVLQCASKKVVIPLAGFVGVSDYKASRTDP